MPQQLVVFPNIRRIHNPSLETLTTPLLVNRDAQAHQPLPCSCVLRGFLRRARPLRDDRVVKTACGFPAGCRACAWPGLLEILLLNDLARLLKALVEQRKVTCRLMAATAQRWRKFLV